MRMKAVAALLLLTASGLSLTPPAWADLPASVNGLPLPSLAPVLKKAMPAVVNISTKTQIEIAENPLMQDPFFRHFFGIPNQPRRRESTSLGSGVIVDARRGYILTNNHVIDKADEISVTLRDGRQLSAKLVGADPESDLAVIKVEPKNLTELPIGDSSQLEVGDFVIAIGNPFGLGQTVTSGIVSALGRSGLGIEGYEDFIQTDASINPGNSGGALINLRGELVGVNTAIIAPTGGNVGIGFAIPSNMAASIMTQLVEKGEIRRGQIGITIQDLTPDLAQAFGLDQNQGAVITGVQKDSPAASSGLEAGDIVLSINDRPVRNSADVRNTIGLLPIGEEVRVEVMHKGARVVREVVIRAPKLVQEEGSKIHPRLSGVILKNNAGGGVQVEKIHTGSYAFQAGLRPGDIIVMANRAEIETLDDLKRATKGRSELLLSVQRGSGSFFLMLK
ncbi:MULTISPECIES: DegQ family serine endoprotease [Methylococcus]|uniref:DegQ family serine endoprotease n=1 Tax=Methylococcus capsulatus TaxID=414 RepID=A0ABZ2F940_METCP|nr:MULTISPECIES: DegQ family serine endoprotease [Methylococcus]MDF9393568.1 DegQ family serine endoprotease [Methylococcus capsulatus]